jgi:hypothetical protein
MTDERGEKERRRAAHKHLGEYHERELLALLARVRDGFARLDAGELDAFELDELIIATSARRRSCGSSAASIARNPLGGCSKTLGSRASSTGGPRVSRDGAGEAWDCTNHVTNHASRAEGGRSCGRLALMSATNGEGTGSDRAALLRHGIVVLEAERGRVATFTSSKVSAWTPN